MTLRSFLFATLLLAGSAVFAAVSATTVDATAASALLHIEMKARVQVAHAQVLLADVAHMSSPDLDTLRRAMAVPLGTAPRAGEAVSLERDQLQRWLRGQTGLGSEQVKWSGPSVTEISRPTREIAGDELLAVAQAGLRKHLETTFSNVVASRIELQAVAVPANIVTPAATSSLVVRSLATLPLSSRMLVWVDIFADGRYVRSASVRFEVNAFAPAAVATSNLPVGTSLQSTDWLEREVDLARVPDAMVSLPPAMQRLRRPIRSGEAITHAHLQIVPAVTRGEWANLTATAGLVAIESRVEVLQDGRVGQLVRVKPAKGVGSVAARVTGPGSLELQP